MTVDVCLQVDSNSLFVGRSHRSILARCWHRINVHFRLEVQVIMVMLFDEIDKFLVLVPCATEVQVLQDLTSVHSLVMKTTVAATANRCFVVVSLKG